MNIHHLAYSYLGHREIIYSSKTQCNTKYKNKHKFKKQKQNVQLTNIFTDIKARNQLNFALLFMVSFLSKKDLEANIM